MRHGEAGAGSKKDKELADKNYTSRQKFWQIMVWRITKQKQIWPAKRGGQNWRTKNYGEQKIMVKFLADKRTQNERFRGRVRRAACGVGFGVGVGVGVGCGVGSVFRFRTSLYIPQASSVCAILSEPKKQSVSTDSSKKKKSQQSARATYSCHTTRWIFPS